ncbi:JAB domain-containing protein [Myroides pelagicus]|uniref:DNA repair protein n=1 Tax=Myroides pelagicus TaxID=270914 RepID=A0A7K1GPV0_9FLAO|nr:JAB domain-containing protein [Myroides pelagicus]MEC4115082.1 JAB domain-containing protein [Myroides pelagicus]MTH30579.1 DNA repair protein [Myroides pelagicus]
MENKDLNNNWLIASEVELIYKSTVKASQRPQITSSCSAYQIALKAWDSNKIELLEQFKVLMLSSSNKVLGVLEASSGGITGTIVDLRIIFCAILKANAVGFLVVHNHPSGKLVPSEVDRQITRKIKEASKILDIAFLDHLIISKEGYYSFADEGIL